MRPMSPRSNPTIIVEKLKKGYVVKDTFGQIIGACESDYSIKGLIDDAFEELEEEEKNKPDEDPFPPPEMTKGDDDPIPF